MEYQVIVKRCGHGIFIRRFNTLSQLAKYAYEIIRNSDMSISICRLEEDLSCKERKIFLNKYLALFNKDI